jgi:signal transduction histidine kinase
VSRGLLRLRAAYGVLVSSSDPSAAPPAPRPGLSTFAKVWLWGWLAIVQLILDLITAPVYILVVVLLVSGVASIPAALLGVPFVVVGLFSAVLLGNLERLRLLAFTGIAIGPPNPPRPDQPAWRRLLLDARPWRASAHLALMALWGVVVGGIMLVLTCIVLALALLPLYRGTVPAAQLDTPWVAPLREDLWVLFSCIGVAGLILLPLVARGLVTVDILLARHLLGPNQEEQVRQLSQRVETLTQTRTAAVDSVEAERRRIERDLHDGPQQRLVSIAMDLGMAREKLKTDPDKARDLLDKAHLSAKEAIVEMRQVARGITPPVLTDRGLDAALSALAARAPVPVQVSVNVPVRPSPTVEAIAYFVVSEALTNVAKHARARAAQVDVRGGDGRLWLRVSDDGVGGADAVRGTGLHGLNDRVRAVDGVLDVSSPPGGPTVLTAALPDARLSPPPEPPKPPPAPKPPRPVTARTRSPQ